MTGYRLTCAASDDLAALFIEGVELFGLAQADRYYDGLADTFAFLSEYPYAAREREEIRAAVRVYPYKAHVIVYELETGGGVLILRVRHGREDWLTEMNESSDSELN